MDSGHETEIPGSTLKFRRLAIADVVLVTPKVVGDARGFFMETWREDLFAGQGLPTRFVQDNHSRSGRGVLRGLHYQVRQPQGKLVRVTHGEVFDVAVDLRRSSPTFGRWVGEVLSADNRCELWIPPGFAHGFYVVSDFADFSYKCTDYYTPEHERSLRWDDPDIGITWPLAPGAAPRLSAKDTAAPRLTDAEVYP